MRSKWDSVLTASLLGCALITTCLVVRREFAPKAPPTTKPVFIKDWKSRFADGTHLGPVTAPIQVVAFTDFECPFCATFHKNVNSLRERYPSQVSVTYIHFPLPGHRFALPAARVEECANDQGRFEAMFDQLFDGQDQLGLKPWADYAAAAGVPDMAAFDSCIKNTRPITRVEEGKSLGAKLDVRATPTIIVNGWRLGRPPTAEELDQIVKRLLGGKSPVDAES